jgi:AcrR family transcriptional regulator
MSNDNTSCKISKEGSERSGGSLRDARRLFTRQRICEAARELFVEQGYAATTMEQIAAKTGAQRATIYNHYRDKNDILAAIAEDYLTRLIELIAELPGPVPSYAQIEVWVKKVVAFTLDQKMPTVLLMSLGDSIDVPELIDIVGEREIEAFARRLPAFARAVNAGPERGLARARAAAVLRQLGWACLHAMQPQRVGSADDTLAVAVELFERFVTGPDGA